MAAYRRLLPRVADEDRHYWFSELADLFGERLAEEDRAYMH
jgi:hypothetical protein